jgi:RNA polymerase sigma factor (sigma-70 family)
MSQTTDYADAVADGLFARARAGDQDAWEELFRTCYPKVVRVVRRKLDRPLRSLYDSTDFASDVWKSLAAKCDRFDFPSIDSLMAFLKQAAEQKVIDEHRRRHALKRDIGRERPMDAGRGERAEPIALPSSDPTPSQVVQADETRDQLLARLTPPQREIIELKLQGLSNEAIAERTGWHLRALQRFLKNLHDSWETPGGGQ